MPWPSGITFRDPTKLPGHLAILGAPAQTTTLRPGDFDLRNKTLAQGDGKNAVELRHADGYRAIKAAQGINLSGVNHVTLSPDARFAVVQAVPPTRAIASDGSTDWDLFRIDLQTGMADTVANSTDPEVGAQWSPDGARLAYSVLGPDGWSLKVVSVLSWQPILTIPGAGGPHIAWSGDGSTILEAGSLTTYDSATGQMIGDSLQATARAKAVTAGYDLEDRFPGVPHRGTFPLDADFSPDGKSVVFDGAVRQGSLTGIIVVTMGLDGSAFTVVAGAFTVQPATTHGLTESEVNPMWT